MKFAEARQLRTDIAAVVAEMVAKKLDPQSVVLTEEQHRAMLMTDGPELRLAGRRLVVVSDVAVGAPLPGGVFQVLEGIPETKEATP